MYEIFDSIDFISCGSSPSEDGGARKIHGDLSFRKLDLNLNLNLGISYVGISNVVGMPEATPVSTEFDIVSSILTSFITI